MFQVSHLLQYRRVQSVPSLQASQQDPVTQRKWLITAVLHTMQTIQPPDFQ